MNDGVIYELQNIVQNLAKRIDSIEIRLDVLLKIMKKWNAEKNE